VTKKVGSNAAKDGVRSRGAGGPIRFNLKNAILTIAARAGNDCCAAAYAYASV
jgi:hypothetical protein